MQFSLHPSQRGPVGPQTYPMVIFSNLEFIAGGDILSYLENRHTGSLTHGERTVMVGKLAWKPLEWPLPPQIASKKLHCIPGWITEISATTKSLKAAGLVIPTSSWFSSPIRPLQRIDGSWILENDSGTFVNLIKG